MRYRARKCTAKLFAVIGFHSSTASHVEHCHVTPPRFGVRMIIATKGNQPVQARAVRPSHSKSSCPLSFESSSLVCEQ